MILPGAIDELERDVLPIYAEHERTFDEAGIHGRLHIGRAVLFAEFMSRHYHAHTQLRPAADDVRFAVAFHDAARRANGPDFWDHESAALCARYAALHPEKFPRGPEGMAAILAAKPDPPADAVEARIVHDADVLEIMRPCCGHGGREGFRESALLFLGPSDPARPRDERVRSRLIEEAWELIRASEARKESLRSSAHFMRDLLGILAASRSACPMLAQALLEP